MQAPVKRAALEGLQSFVVLNNGRQMPALGFGVYAMEAGEETENAVLWALEVTEAIVPVAESILSILLDRGHTHASVANEMYTSFLYTKDINASTHAF